MDKPTYDSKRDTQAHIDIVRALLDQVIKNFARRGVEHDASKFVTPEKQIFDEMTPKLRAVTYGSEEYKAFLVQMKPALDHHYANNSHHPEHYPNGIAGMSLLDVLEMLADWKAAGQRHADGSMRASLDHNRKRFGIDDQLFAVLENTVRELGWL